MEIRPKINDVLRETENAYGFSLTKVVALVTLPFIVVFIFSMLRIIPSTRDIAHSAVGENNPIELLTFAFLFLAGIVGLLLAWRARAQEEELLVTGFYVLFSAGLLVIAMEEVAWGQWFFGFDTPETIAKHNDQGETTLHNLRVFGINVGGLSDGFYAIIGLGGAIGVWIGTKRQFWKITPPAILLGWFLLIALLGGADVYVDHYIRNSLFATGVESLAELNEMLFGLLAFIYLWLNTKRLKEHWNRT